jgi:hypothetical protein
VIYWLVNRFVEEVVDQIGQVCFQRLSQQEHASFSHALEVLEEEYELFPLLLAGGKDQVQVMKQIDILTTEHPYLRL